MSAVVPYRPAAAPAIPPPQTWIEVAEMAKMVANTEFVPKSLRGNPAAIAAAILYGDEIGLRPMSALQLLAVVDGRPNLYAEGQRALILQAGHEIWLKESTTTRATWAGRRRDSDKVVEITWTMDDAKRAGLAGRVSYRTYPRAMLSARASAELARTIFADAIRGLPAIEELAEYELNGATAESPADTPAETAARSRQRRRGGQRAPAALPASTDAADQAEGEQAPRPGDQGEPQASEAARRRMHALFRDAGIDDRAERLAYTNALLERDVTTSTELTASEIQIVMRALEQGDQGSPAPPPAPAPAPDAEPGPDQPPDNGPEPASPAGETYSAKRTTLPATEAQRRKLDELVAKVTGAGRLSVGQLWRVIAADRDTQLAQLAGELNGFGEDGLLQPGPLLDALTRAEADTLAGWLAEVDDQPPPQGPGDLPEGF